MLRYNRFRQLFFIQHIFQVYFQHPADSVTCGADCTTRQASLYKWYHKHLNLSLTA